MVAEDERLAFLEAFERSLRLIGLEETVISSSHIVVMQGKNFYRLMCHDFAP